MTQTIGQYESEYAFRVALETRLRNMSKERSTDLQRLHRNVAFDRLLARLFAPGQPRWVLKGGYAQEMRFPNRARSTGDIDLSLQDTQTLSLEFSCHKPSSPSEIIYEHLQIAADLDLGDGFRFVIRQPVSGRAAILENSARCSVEVRLAGRPFARFHVDVGWADAIVGVPEWIEGSQWLSFAGIAPALVALYPLELQFAEKIHAYTKPWRDRENTRVKDLVDLVLLISANQMDPAKVREALSVTFQTRNTHPLMSYLPSGSLRLMPIWMPTGRTMTWSWVDTNVCCVAYRHTQYGSVKSLGGADSSSSRALGCPESAPSPSSDTLEHRHYYNKSSILRAASSCVLGVTWV